MNQIRLMVRLTMMGLTPNPLVRTLFTVFICVLTNYIGSVCRLGSGVFVPTGIESKCEDFVFFVFIPIGVESKGGQLIKTIWRSNTLFYF